MKNLRNLFGVILVIACAFAACELPEPTNKNPVVGDYDITNLAQSVGKPTAVSITPKSGKSSGARTIYYEGTGGTNYAKSTALPTVGTSGTTYAVTFDVAAADGWNAVSGLYAGTLFFGTQTPVAGDYEFSGLAQTLGSVTAVTITPKSGKSPGAVSNIKYAGNAALPTAKGTYAVTFDVAAAAGWNKADGLSAGNLEINENQTPVAGDYEIGDLTQSLGSVTAVTITPKSGKSPGAVSNIKYAGNAALPTTAGTYAVTFDVAAAAGWNPATGLNAGNLVISATQSQTLAVTIIGTPGVGKRLTADVQKNFSGKNEYQWLREVVAIQGEDWFEYTPEPQDAGKKISVKVTCGTATPATSTAVTIPALTFTAEADRWENILWTYAKIGDYTYEPNLNNGFTVQWLRNGSPISGATRPEYELTAEDAGKTIKAEIKGYNQTKYSQEFQINSLAPVQPVIDIEYEDHTTRSSNDIWTVMEEIQDAYDRNLANCKDAIRDTGKQNNWMIDICEAKLDRRAEIKNNKLHIWFSMRYYDEEFSEHERGLRLSYIGEELRTLVMGMSLGMEEENTDELEEGRSIHMGMGKLVKQQPKTLDDHA